MKSGFQNYVTKPVVETNNKIKCEERIKATENKYNHTEM
jgi:hypothetical protein